jgi:hypothetical protein
MDEQYLHLNAQYGMAHDGGLSSAITISTRGRTMALSGRTFLKRIRVLQQTHRDYDYFQGPYLEEQMTLYNWALDTIKMFSKLSSWVVSQPVAAEAHIKDFQATLSLSIKPATDTPSFKDLATANLGLSAPPDETSFEQLNLTVSSANPPQRGLLEWRIYPKPQNYALHQDQDIFIPDLFRYDNFKDPTVLLTAWRQMRIDFQNQYADAILAQLRNLPYLAGLRIDLVVDD